MLHLAWAEIMYTTLCNLSFTLFLISYEKKTKKKHDHMPSSSFVLSMTFAFGVIYIYLSLIVSPSFNRKHALAMNRVLLCGYINRKDMFPFHVTLLILPPSCYLLLTYHFVYENKIKLTWNCCLRKDPVNYMYPPRSRKDQIYECQILIINFKVLSWSADIGGCGGWGKVGISPCTFSNE